MNATSMGVASSRGAGGSGWDLYKGWIVGLLIIVIVLSLGAGFWLHYHP
jgi:hypothetical protein